MIKFKSLPPLSRLLELLTYDPETGDLFWKVDRGIYGIRIKAGWPAGGLNIASGYIMVKIDGVSYPAHRIAWKMYYGEEPKEQIDHINLCQTENQITNLREATHAENTRNRGRYANNTSGFKGVSFKRNTGKWVAVIYLDKKNRHLGVFPTAAEAHQAYCKAAAEKFGEFARFE